MAVLGGDATELKLHSCIGFTGELAAVQRYKRFYEQPADLAAFFVSWVFCALALRSSAVCKRHRSAADGWELMTRRLLEYWVYTCPKARRVSEPSYLL